MMRAVIGTVAVLAGFAVLEDSVDASTGLAGSCKVAQAYALMPAGEQLAVRATPTPEGAVVGMIVSMAVAVLAHYGLKLDAAKATGLLVAVDAIVFSWIHGNVSPVMPAVWRQRRN